MKFPFETAHHYYKILADKIIEQANKNANERFLIAFRGKANDSELSLHPRTAAFRNLFIEHYPKLQSWNSHSFTLYNGSIVKFSLLRPMMVRGAYYRGIWVDWNYDPATWNLLVCLRGCLHAPVIHRDKMFFAVSNRISGDFNPNLKDFDACPNL